MSPSHSPLVRALAMGSQLSRADVKPFSTPDRPHLQIERLLTRQILCAHHHTEWVDPDFNRGRSRDLEQMIAWEGPYCKTSQDLHTGDNRGERGLAHLVSLSSALNLRQQSYRTCRGHDAVPSV